jgi:hypothetical protein
MLIADWKKETAGNSLTLRVAKKDTNPDTRRGDSE